MSYAKAMRNGLQVYLGIHFPPGEAEYPERLFVSAPLLRILQTERPVCLSFDGESMTFEGIPVTVYEAEEPEYYFGQRRGEFYEF